MEDNLHAIFRFVEERGSSEGFKDGVVGTNHVMRADWRKARIVQ